MKLCHSEVMKRIKELESKKQKLLNIENKRCRIRYKQEENKVVTDYSYAGTRAEVEKLDKEIRRLRYELAKANCTVKVDGFNVTIGEALVMLAQLNSLSDTLEDLADNEQLTRSLSYNGVVEYTECTYSVEQAAKDLLKTEEKISKLQVAIDRANLTNYIEL